MQINIGNLRKIGDADLLCSIQFLEVSIQPLGFSAGTIKAYLVVIKVLRNLSL